MIAYLCSIARYWKDPYEFRPQRFMEDWPKDAFLPFSGGARQCIGRRYVNSSLSLQYFFTENNSKRFSETESIAILTILIQRYRVEVLEEPQFASETYEERYKRVLAVTAGITNT